jgi:hypothetical protein
LRDNTEELPPNFASWIAEQYNAGFHMDKLLAALDYCRITGS